MTKLPEFKRLVEQQQVPNDFLIFLDDGSDWLIEEYVQRICDDRMNTPDISEELELGYNRVEISELSSSINAAVGLVIDLSTNLYILRADTFSEVSDDYSRYKNVIVICKKIDKKILSKVDEFVVKFTPLVEWQKIAFMKQYCSDLSEDDLTALCRSAKGDMHRIVNELDKIKMFSPQERESVLSDILSESSTDLFDMPIFSLTDAILKQDRYLIAEYFRHASACDFDPLAISSILLKSCLKALFVTQNSGANLESLGISSKQAWAIRKNYSNVSAEKLESDIQFLSSVDLKLKQGRLDMPKQKLLDYIILRLI